MLTDKALLATRRSCPGAAGRLWPGSSPSEWSAIGIIGCTREGLRDSSSIDFSTTKMGFELDRFLHCQEGLSYSSSTAGLLTKMRSGIVEYSTLTACYLGCYIFISRRVTRYHVGIRIEYAFMEDLIYSGGNTYRGILLGVSPSIWSTERHPRARLLMPPAAEQRAQTGGGGISRLQLSDGLALQDTQLAAHCHGVRTSVGEPPPPWTPLTEEEQTDEAPAIDKKTSRSWAIKQDEQSSRLIPDRCFPCCDSRGHADLQAYCRREREMVSVPRMNGGETNR
jgi:hypothetical protein